MAPANTGKESNNNTAVILTDQLNKETSSNFIPLTRKLIIVVIKLIAPKIDETPAKCNEKIVKSTEQPAWAILLAKGGYTVQPVPAPLSTTAEKKSNLREAGSSQKLILFIRGNTISGARNISGTNQFPNPPTITGMTKKKIMIKA